MDNTVGSRRNLTSEERAIVIGSILGDGCLERRSSKSVRLKIGHGLQQKKYLAWKHQLLQGLVTTKRPVFVRGAVHPKNGKRYNRVESRTYSTQIFDPFLNMFYVGNRKQVPQNIPQILTHPLSLVVWFMDDGYKRNDCAAFRLNTDSFSLEEQKLLKECLSRNFLINASIHAKGRYYNLYFPRNEAEKLRNIIERYVIPSMRYKISLDPVTTRSTHNA